MDFTHTDTIERVLAGRQAPFFCGAPGRAHLLLYLMPDAELMTPNVEHAGILRDFWIKRIICVRSRDLSLFRSFSNLRYNCNEILYLGSSVVGGGNIFRGLL